MNDERNRLKLLSIFQYIFGALTALFACIQLEVFASLFTYPEIMDESTMPDGLELRIMLVIFILFVSFLIIKAFATAICSALVGWFLGQRTHYRFCMIVSAFECLTIPLGTILGVFTLFTLSRDSMRARFDHHLPPPLLPGPPPLPRSVP